MWLYVHGPVLGSSLLFVGVWYTCMCVYTFIYLWIHACRCVCALAHGGLRSQVSPQEHYSPPCEIGSLVCWELTNREERLDGQWAVVTHLSLSPLCWDCEWVPLFLEFVCAFWELNSCFWGKHCIHRVLSPVPLLFFLPIKVSVLCQPHRALPSVAVQEAWLSGRELLSLSFLCFFLPLTHFNCNDVLWQKKKALLGFWQE